jgi:hypothetical protein
MYDGLTGLYTFACPVRGEVRLPLSAFRIIDRLPGAAHPAVYKITFSCDCGDEHEGLGAQDEVGLPRLGKLGELLDGLVQRLRVGEERHDVLEDDSPLGEVRDVPDLRLQVNRHG